MKKKGKSGRSIMKTFVLMMLILSVLPAAAQKKPLFRALVVYSKAADHEKMISAARPFFEKLAADNNFAVEISDNRLVTDKDLKNYQVFIQLQEAPFDLSAEQQAALQKFIEKGNGWVGIHAAGLTGQSFSNAPKKAYWQWFEDYMGGVTYLPHPAFQKGTVLVEDRNHPATKGLPAKFEISDEWYEFNKSPRGNVRVLATADESTYKQNKPMGDHPIIWTNEKFRRMIYIGVGHDPLVFSNESYVMLLRNAILWAGEKK